MGTYNGPQDSFPEIVFVFAIIMTLPVIAAFIYGIYIWISNIVETAKSKELDPDTKSFNILKIIAGGVAAIAFIWIFGGIIGGIIVICGVIFGLSYWWWY